MTAYRIMVSKPVKMEITGKFVAPSEDWKHMNRILFDYELVVVTKGTLYMSNGEQQFLVSHGEYLLLPPLSPQYGYKSSDCSFYWLHFSTEHGVQAINLSTSTSNIKLTGDTSALSHADAGEIVIPQYGKLASVEKMIVLMKQLQDCVREYNEQTLNDYMTTTILCELNNQVWALSKEHNQRSQRKQDQLYNDIVDYIKWSRSEPLKVSQIAQHFNYNEKYLSQLFRQKSGITLKQYMLEQKMELAKFLLTDTNQNINEIAAQLGYTDSHNFMKSFKKIVGLTPTEFRNAYAKRLLFYE
ncbi:YesN/AraC family two-component response regulator [Paenibacillus turicensis]|uniref:YesN/AraC family two-component response regulator n=1 Tax=Paenibacillus turicensis TaxID=160487 RepID=A0ABS4FY85_9BACL|nr:AraC family transcriptional regulator [Paenibacillus turicensis]MBP1907537.1 YesN/AraC family two-component response regulator [Paenibacillus turicensis]